MIDLEHHYQRLHNIWSIGVANHFWSNSRDWLRNLRHLIRVISLATSQHWRWRALSPIIIFQILLCNIRERGQQVYTSSHGILQVYMKADRSAAERNTTIVLNYRGKKKLLLLIELKYVFGYTAGKQCQSLQSSTENWEQNFVFICFIFLWNNVYCFLFIFLYKFFNLVKNKLFETWVKNILGEIYVFPYVFIWLS